MRRNTTEKSLQGRASTQRLMTCHTVSRHISVRSCQWWRGKTSTWLWSQPTAWNECVVATGSTQTGQRRRMSERRTSWQSWGWRGPRVLRIGVSHPERDAILNVFGKWAKKVLKWHRQEGHFHRNVETLLVTVRQYRGWSNNFRFDGSTQWRLDKPLGEKIAALPARTLEMTLKEGSQLQ